MTKNFNKKWERQHRATLIQVRWVEAAKDGYIIRREETWDEFQAEGGSMKPMFLMYISFKWSGRHSRWEEPSPKAKAIWKVAV